MPALWRAKLTDGYTLGNYSYLTYADEGESYRGRGFVYTSGAPENAFHTLLDVDPEAPLSDFGWEYLRKTAEFCQENGMNLVLFTAPLPQRLPVQYGQLPGLRGRPAGFCRRE